MLTEKYNELEKRMKKLIAILNSNDYDPIKLEKQLNELESEFSKLEKEVEKQIDKERL
jgi:TolA-binding protein